MAFSQSSDSSGDQEQLSAYLDNQLSDVERKALEQRLQHDQQLQAELRALQVVKTLLHDLPTVAAPRSFTLDPATVRQPTRFPLFNVFRLGSALATVLLVLTFTFDFINTGTNANAPMSAQAPMPAATTAAAAGAFESRVPDASMLSAATSAPSSDEPTAGGASDAAAAPTQASAATAAPATADNQQSSAMQQRKAEASPAVADGYPAVGAAPPEVAPPAPLHASGSSSPGTNESGLPAAVQANPTHTPTANTALHWLELALGVLALGLASCAWLAWRQQG